MSLYNIVPSSLLQLFNQYLDRVAATLKLVPIPEDVKKSSWKINDKTKSFSTSNHSGDSSDIILLMQHPVWSSWINRIDEVVNAVSEKLNEKIGVKTTFSAHGRKGCPKLFFTLDKASCISYFMQILTAPGKLLSSSPQLDRLIKSYCIEVVHIIPTGDRDVWSTRLQIVTEVGLKSYKNTFQEIKYQEFHEGLVDCFTFDAKATSEQLQDWTFDKRIDVASALTRLGVTFQPEFTGFVHLNSENKLKFAQSLVNVVSKKPGDSECHSFSTDFFLKDNRLVFYQQVLILALILASKKRRILSKQISLVPVGSVVVQGYDKIEDIEEYLKNMIATKSVDEDEVNNAINGSPESFPLPSIDEGRVKCLVDTCLKCSMLSQSHNTPGRLQIDMASMKNYIFIQYNLARLNNIFRRYEEEYLKKTEVGGCSDVETDLGELGSSEWKLIFEFLLPFDDLFLPSEVTGLQNKSHWKNLDVYKLIQFMLRASKEFSYYYRNTRVLLDSRQEHTLPLVHARVVILRLFHKMLTLCLNFLNIEPVDRM